MIKLIERQIAVLRALPFLYTSPFRHERADGIGMAGRNEWRIAGETRLKTSHHVLAKYEYLSASY